jgi:hypothetical protein
MAYVKLNELGQKAQLYLTDLMAVSDSNGVLYGNTLQEFFNLFNLEFKGSISAGTYATKDVGWYFATNTGNYIMGSTTIAVDVSDTLTIIIVPTVINDSSKVEVPISGITIDAVPTSGSTNAVQSGGAKTYIDVADALKQNTIQPTAVLTDVSAYIQNGAYTASGVYNAFVNYRSIVDYPTVAGKKIKILGLGSGNKYGIFKNASDVIVGSVFFVNSNTIYTVPATATKACFTLVGGADTPVNVAYPFYLGNNDADFIIDKINSFPLFDIGAVRKEETYIYANNSQITTALMGQVNEAVEEIYIPDYSTTYDYLLSVFRFKESLSSVITIDVRVAQVQKGTTTLIKYYQFSKTGPEAVDYVAKREIIELTNGGYILIDWTKITSGTGYGALSTNYLLSANIGNPFFYETIKSIKNTYNKTEGDARYALKEEIGNTDLFFTKAESNANYAAKTTTENQLSNHESRVSQNEADIASIEADVTVINTSLSALSGSVPDGAIAGDNTWLGANTFSQPITGVAPTNDNHYIRQLEYKNTLHRFVNAEDFGFKPTATASENVTALNAALNGGNKTVIISKPGIYEMNNVAYIDDNTHIWLCKGVVLKKVTTFSFLLLNRGALTHSFNSNIKITGLTIDANQIDAIPALATPLHGLRGHASFLCVNNLTILDFKCFNYNTPQWALHVCTFNNLIVDRFECRGNKDGIHLGRGDGFVIKNGICETYDDAIALNGHDYVSCNPEVGDIKNGLIQNVVDINQANTTGYFSRLLTGAWVNWYLGMNIRHGDTVVNNGKTYRANSLNGATVYQSQTEPTIAVFDATQADASGGFQWKLFQNDATYSANIYNVEFRDIICLKPRVFINVELDSGGTAFNRSLYPDVLPADYPYTNKIRLINCDLQASTSVVNSAQKFDFYIDNIYNHNCTINLNNVTSGVGKATIVNCDFTKVVGKNAINSGSNTYIKVRDCQHNGSIPIAANGRFDSNENLSGFSNIVAQKGDMLKVADVPYYRGDSTWVSQI